MFECFVCKEFINEKFRLRGQNKDGVTLFSVCKPQKDSKITNRIAIYRDEISLNTEKKKNGMTQDNSIYLEDKQIILKSPQAEDNSGIQKILDMPISIYNDKITRNISMMTTDNHKVSQKILMKKLSAPIRYDIRY